MVHNGLVPRTRAKQVHGIRAAFAHRVLPVIVLALTILSFALASTWGCCSGPSPWLYLLFGFPFVGLILAIGLCVRTMLSTESEIVDASPRRRFAWRLAVLVWLATGVLSLAAI